MINLKKLIYQYRYLKLDLDEISDEHSKLVSKFEKEFVEVLPKEEPKPDTVKVKEKKESIPNDFKKIYKETAKQLHPDKGGDEELFKELNSRYNSNDLLGVVDFAFDNNIDIKLSDDDLKYLLKSITFLESQIDNKKTTLAYVWEYGNKKEKYSVISTLSNHLNKKITIDELSDSIKSKLDFKEKK